jgi:hypothetical protein
VRPWALAVAATLLLGTAGCGLLFPGPPDGGATPAPVTEPGDAPPQLLDDGTDLPVGHGTLRQSDISVDLRRGELQMRITPLTESVTRVTAPDTYDRLSALARSHQEIFRERTGAAVPFQLFLVSLYTEMGDVTFEPEDLSLVSRGLRYRPVEIHAVTPGWERQRLEPRQTLIAIYAFPGEVDLERDLEVEYQELRSREWERILPAIQAERARVRARALPPGTPSRAATR